MNRSRIVAAAALAMAPGAALAQTSELFINSFDTNNMVVVQGGSTIRSWTTITNGENALAVSGGEIRTGGSGIFSRDGHQYDANGNPLGGTYTMPSQGNWYDGTTDGQNYNFAVQHNGDYSVHRFDRTWGSDTALFSVGPYYSGLTYDTTNNTLWASDALNKLVTNFDMSGNPMGSFSVPEVNYAYGLALDPADGTLWVGQYGSNVIAQYKKDGTYLNSVAVNGIDMAFGIEFDVRGVPAPGAAALLGLGGLFAGRRRR